MKRYTWVFKYPASMFGTCETAVQADTLAEALAGLMATFPNGRPPGASCSMDFDKWVDTWLESASRSLNAVPYQAGAT